MGDKGLHCLRQANQKAGLDYGKLRRFALIALTLGCFVPLAQAQPIIVQNPTNAVSLPRKPVVLSVIAQGTGRLKYRWEKDGQLLGARRPVLRFRAQPWRAGTYRAIVIDQTGQQV